MARWTYGANRVGARLDGGGQFSKQGLWETLVRHGDGHRFALFVIIVLLQSPHASH